MSKTIMLQGTAGPFETFVAQWLRMQGYLVQAPVNYRRKGGTSVLGNFWSDVDVVGTKGKEFVIVECKEWISTSKRKLALEVERKFENARTFFEEVGLTRDRNLRFIFAQIDKDSDLEELLKSSATRLKKSIEYYDFNQIAAEMIQKIRPYITKSRIGKFGEPMSWLLSRLIYAELLRK